MEGEKQGAGRKGKTAGSARWLAVAPAVQGSGDRLVLEAL